eukprot:2129329-Prorocentrum_lima.AAC.1
MDNHCCPYRRSARQAATRRKPGQHLAELRPPARTAGKLRETRCPRSNATANRIHWPCARKLE